MSIATFEEAVETISNKMNKTMSNDELKEIYALYKQATVGDVNVDRPGMLIKGVSDLKDSLNYWEDPARSYENFCFSCPNRTVLLTDAVSFYRSQNVLGLSK